MSNNLKLILYTLQDCLVSIYEKHNLYGQIQCSYNSVTNEYIFNYMNYLIFKKDTKDLSIYSDTECIRQLFVEFELDAMIRSEQMFPTGVVIQ